MPRIAPYQQQTRAPRPIAQTVDLGPGASVGLGAMAQAFGSIAQDQAALQAFAEKKREERAAVWAHEQVTGVRSHWLEELPRRQEAASETAEGFTLQALADFDAQADELIKAAPTQASRNWLKERLSAVRLGLQQDALLFEARRGVEFKVNGLARSVDQARIAAEFRPEDFPVLAAEQLAAIEASGLDASTQAKLIQDSQLKLADAAVRGMIRRDPYAALKELNDEQSQTLSVRALSFDQRQALRSAAETEIRQREAEAKRQRAEAAQALSERVRDATVAYRMGLDFDNPPSRAEFIAALGADDGNAAYEAFAKEQALAPVVRQLATASDAEQAQILAEHAPRGTAGVAEAAERYRLLTSRVEALQRERAADPAAYALRYSPGVAQAFAAAQDSPEAAREYARATLAEQQRLGIKQPRILPETMASDIAQSFYGRPGEQTAALIQAERERWGSHWPQVFGELSAQKLPPAALAIGRGMAPGPSARLAAVAAVPMDELKKGITVPPRDVTEEISSAMGDFGLTLDGVIGAENTFASMYEAIERLTYSYLRQGQSVGDAVEQAYREVIGDHYAFREVNDRLFRVPIELDSPAIEIMARDALASVPVDELAPPVPTEQGSPEQAAEDLRRAIQRRGYWVTSADGERGLALFLDGAPVLRKDGSVYEVTFADLAAQADARSERIRSQIEAERIRQLEQGR